MDTVDPNVPLFVFILDLEGTTNYASLGDIPKSFLAEYIELVKLSSGTPSKENPLVAIRGSTAHFGSWDRDGLKATKLLSGVYACVINDFIPSNGHYKWLDINGVHSGDRDPDTNYSYEPQPFIDRSLDFTKERDGGEIVFVIDRWGEYDRHVHSDFLDNWMPATKIDEAASSEKEEVTAVDKSEKEAEEAPVAPPGDDKTDEGFVECEEISLSNEVITSTVTTTTTATNVSSTRVSDDAVNNNQPDDVSPSPTETTEDVFKVTKVETTSLLRSKKKDEANKDDVDSNMNAVSDASFKRMSRISETEAPEVDQVLKVIVCEEISTITVKQTERLPSSSSC